MKSCLLGIFVLLASCTFAQESGNDEVGKQRALVFSPLDQGLGYRSNLSKKNFFDLELRYSLLLGAFKFEPEFSWKHRVVNDPNKKFYWGAGVSFDYFFPQLIVPIGIELLPFDKIPNVSLFVEAVPAVLFVGTFGVKGKSNFGIAYYFDKRK